MLAARPTAPSGSPRHCDEPLGANADVGVPPIASRVIGDALDRQASPIATLQRFQVFDEIAYLPVGQP